MKKWTIVFLLISLFSVTLPNSGRAKVDPRMVALGTVAAYGTVGGALLGTASMAFGTGGRAVAQGASIGLYLGLIFGSYIVVSHSIKKGDQGGAAQDAGYYDDTTPYGSGPSDIPSPAPAVKYWSDQGSSSSNSIYELRPKNDKTLIYFNLLNSSF
jgi:hypothetical protein